MGDDRLGNGKEPAVTAVLSAPITGLSFNATGTRVAVTDSTVWLVIWDVAAAKAVHCVKRPMAVKAMAYGPTDDVILLAAGKTVEVWWLPGPADSAALVEVVAAGKTVEVWWLPELVK